MNIDKESFNLGEEVLQRRSHMSPKRLWKTLLFFLGSFALGFLFFLFLFWFFIGKFSLIELFLTAIPTRNLSADTNVLILGVDATEGVQRSDMIMVLHVSPRQRRTNILSIPRDTLVNIPGRGMDKVNHAYAFGGVELSQKTLSEFLGVPLPQVILIKVDGLVNLIDKIGGVEIDVEERMYYVDYAGNFFVDLKPGLQRLNGRQAMGYVRFRYDQRGDLGRIERQQKFVKALTAELAKGQNIFKLPSLLFDLGNNIKTTLSSSQILSLLAEIRTAYALENIHIYTLPAASTNIDGVFYFKADPDETKKLLDEFFSANDLAPPFISSPPRIPNMALPDELKVVRLKVLNGIGTTGLAYQAASAIKQKGFDAVYYGDAEKYGYKNSMLLNWKLHPQRIAELAQYFNIDKSQVVNKRDYAQAMDVALILGADWNQK